MGYAIIKHLTFNEWANTKLAEVILAVDDVIYYQKNRSSFHSVAKTIMHIWDAQDIWLKRMRIENVDTWPSANFTGTKEDALRGLIQSSNDIYKFIESKDEVFLTSTYAYKNMRGDWFEDSYEETLFHVVNHSTYHRGQIITMLREAGVKNVVSTDLIHYLRGLTK